MKDHKGLIANANCSTIQMVVTLAPLIREFGIQKVVVSTYQAVSARDARESRPWRTAGRTSTPSHSRERHPLIGGVGEDGLTTEETKMREESRKILGLPDLGGARDRRPHPRPHRPLRERLRRDGEECSVARGRRGSARRPGVVFSGDPDDFPTPLEAAGEPGTYVGRIRVDDRSISYWCVSDNLLKGAATNAVQIAEALAGRGSSVPHAGIRDTGRHRRRRPASLSLIMELAEYERLSHEVAATEETLRHSLFGEQRVAEALLGYLGGDPAGFALFFHNFSTFLGSPASTWRTCT